MLRAIEINITAVVSKATITPSSLPLSVRIHKKCLITQKWADSVLR